MACEQYLNAIHDLVDGTLGALRRSELELHLESCPACAALLADLQELARATESLDDLQPPAHVWTQIVDRLRQEGRVAPTPYRAFLRPGYSMLALAATLVLIVGASLLLIWPRTPPPTGPDAGNPALTPNTASGNPPGADSVQGIAQVTTDMALAEKYFESALDGLKKIEGSVSPQTVTLIQEKLLVVNDAMEESRKALEANPQDAAARESFYEMLRQKVRFLHDTIALLNEIRQGDAAGAAEIVEAGKSKS